MRVINRIHREIAAFDAGTVAHVANFIVAVSVPRGINCINFVRHFIDFILKPNIIEQKKFRFRTHIGHIANARGDQIGFCALRTSARVTRVAFAGVRLNHCAVNADGFLGIKGVDIGGVYVRHQFHVGFFNGFPTGDRRAVEHKAFFQKVLIDLVSADGDVLQFSARICEANVHIFDAFIGDLR